jgi:hypothetical protein
MVVWGGGGFVNVYIFIRFIYTLALFHHSMTSPHSHPMKDVENGREI